MVKKHGLIKALERSLYVCAVAAIMIKYYFIADHLEAFLNSNAYIVKHYTLGIIYIHTGG